MAHHQCRDTQAAARALHEGAWRDPPLAGFRWWSALTGAWHSTVVFCDRVTPADLDFATPQVILPTDTALQDALDMLGIRR